MAAEIIQIDTQDFTSQIYEGQDTNLISTFDVNTSFGPSSYIEYFIYDNNRNLLSSDTNFTQYTIQNDGQSAGNEEVISQIIIDPKKSLIDNGFDQGEYITYFNFFNKKIGSEFQQLYIAEISSDRTEIRLDSTTLSNLDIVEQTTQFIQEREDSTYFLDFYLNFGENNLAIANNIQLDNTDPNNPTILVKLYESLPEEFDINSTLWVITTLEESIAYKVTFEEEPITFVDFENISGPNFNIDLKDRVNNSTSNLSYNDLFSTSLTSSAQQLNSLLEEKEIDINVDYTSFKNYIHFSSAQTRLENFYSKIQLIEQYSSSIAVLNNTTNSPTSISSSTAVYESKINNIITNFDGYEYFLYYENNQYAWPKTNTQKPYELAKSDSVAVLTWIGSENEYSPYFGGLLHSASLYDNNNKDNLLYSIPEYLRDDPANQQYELFVQMVAQHYDNIWIYYKDVTQKYDADNRLEYGISKDIIADVIRDFGVKLYQNNFSNEDLYTAFLGLTPEGSLFPFPNITGSLPTPSGFEYIDTLISASNDYMPLDDVNKSLYKRIYHNLPYLLKTKGTLPGLRALITSYGIPDTILRINEYGGKDKVDYNDWDYWQNEFNYAFNTSGSNFISSSWELNSNWNAPNDVPATLMFRFKTDGLPTSSISYFQSLWYGDGGSALTLTYTGSAYSSGSYSGSIIDPYHQYATLTFYPDVNISIQKTSVYLPFYDGGWWSVMVTKNSDTYTLYSQNKIYEGGDNGTTLGFKASNSITYASTNWDDTLTSYFPISFSISSPIGYDVSAYDVNVYDETGNLAGSFTAFTGSYQEIRYYTVPISESVFTDYTMNPHSIEGNSLNSSPNELAFRASIGGEQYTASISIHPKIAGSWQTTHSFANDSNFYYDATPNFIPNTEYTFADQPVAGIRNTISDKIRVENNVMPEGDTLSPFKSLSQMANISQSYTPNINYLEVAFSPQNEINEDIVDQLGYFNIGDFIGDPRLRSSSAVTYPALDQLRNEYFQKYTKNYNLVDFIRLIKFFDNSLFKMIRDFIPARTSLASGIVIKQHLLERNKYPQPQMEWQNLDISGTLKPTWNGYQEGTVENFEGQTGGVFDKFNSISNISQSWYETIQTLSGSVDVLHDSQDEFYNGEFSGSTILISEGILNEAYPLEHVSFDYTPVIYDNLSYNLYPQDFFLSFFSPFAESQFLNPSTAPSQGEILLLEPYITNNLTPPIYSKPYVKIHKIDNNGVNNSIALGQAKQLLIKYSTSNKFYTLRILSIKKYPTYYLYEINSLGTTLNNIDNYILDYKFTGSYSSPLNIPNASSNKTILNNISYNPNNFYNTSNGIYSVDRTPNTKLTFKLSGIASAINSTAEMRIHLISTGSNIEYGPQTIDSFPGFTINPGSPITFNWSGSYNTFSPWYNAISQEYSGQLGPGKGLYFEITNDNGEGYYTGDLQITGLTLTIDQHSSPSAAENDPVIIEPYITLPNFYNSDENALLNDAFDLRDSSYYMDVDYTLGITKPVNFQQLINRSATKAKVQDSNYTTQRHILPRYLGSKSTSQVLNKWSPPNTIENYSDQGTYGKLPTIENLNSYIAYATAIGGWPPERMMASGIFIKYLIAQNGDVIIPNTSENSLAITQQNFRSGDKVRISLPSQGGGEVSSLRTIIRGGTRIEPILYTQSGSAPFDSYTSIEFENIIPPNAAGGLVRNVSANFVMLDNTPFPPNYLNWGTDFYFTVNNTISNKGNNAQISGNPPTDYVVTSAAITDGVTLIFNGNGGQIKWRPRLSRRRYPITSLQWNVFLYRKDTNNTTIKTWILKSGISQYYDDGPFKLFSLGLFPSITIPTSDLVVGDKYSVVFYFRANNDVDILTFGIGGSWRFTQIPVAYPNAVPSTPSNIWGYYNSGSYPYVITSSNESLTLSYGDPNIKQKQIAGSGFNTSSLSWSIKYGDEFRFEGREDYTYVVSKIFAPDNASPDRLSQTGSIEVHFNANLPVNADSSIFNLDHFLIRRYVDDASQILIEGFRPVGTTGPYIITPEYVTPTLNKSADAFITDLTERGLL